MISGSAALNPKPAFAAVSTINAAVIALAKAFSKQGIKDGVQVKSVVPGAVMTGRRRSFMEHWAPEHGMSVEEAMRQFPEKAGIARYGEPEEIAGLMAYLVSPEARWLTGASVRMDGARPKGCRVTRTDSGSKSERNEDYQQKACGHICCFGDEFALPEVGATARPIAPDLRRPGGTRPEEPVAAHDHEPCGFERCAKIDPLRDVEESGLPAGFWRTPIDADNWMLLGRLSQRRVYRLACHKSATFQIDNGNEMMLDF